MQPGDLWTGQQVYDILRATVSRVTSIYYHQGQTTSTGVTVNARGHCLKGMSRSKLYDMKNTKPSLQLSCFHQNTLSRAPRCQWSRSCCFDQTFSHLCQCQTSITMEPAVEIHLSVNPKMKWCHKIRPYEILINDCGLKSCVSVSLSNPCIFMLCSASSKLLVLSNIFKLWKWWGLMFCNKQGWLTWASRAASAKIVLRNKCTE